MYNEPKPDMVAIDVMCPNPVSVTVGTDIADAVDLMLDHKAGAVLVIDPSGNLLGMVTASAVIRRVAGRLAEHPSHRLRDFLFPATMARKFARLHGRHVSEVLDASIGAISMETPLKRIVERFDKTSAERLAVVDRGKVVGVVTRADVLRAMVDLYRPRSDVREDSDIREAIVTELARQPWMPRQGVQVSVHSGIADLDGIILDADTRLGITAVVENVPGVMAVHNRLRFAIAGTVGVFLGPEDVNDAGAG